MGLFVEFSVVATLALVFADVIRRHMGMFRKANDQMVKAAVIIQLGGFSGGLIYFISNALFLLTVERVYLILSLLGAIAASVFIFIVIVTVVVRLIQYMVGFLTAKGSNDDTH